MGLTIPFLSMNRLILMFVHPNCSSNCSLIIDSVIAILTSHIYNTSNTFVLEQCSSCFILCTRVSREKAGFPFRNNFISSFGVFKFNQKVFMLCTFTLYNVDPRKVFIEFLFSVIRFFDKLLKRHHVINSNCLGLITECFNFTSGHRNLIPDSCLRISPMLRICF